MLSASRSILAAAIVILSPALVFTGVAYAFDLNGAWATDPDQCSKVFEKKGDSITLSDSSCGWTDGGLRRRCSSCS